MAYIYWQILGNAPALLRMFHLCLSNICRSLDDRATRNNQLIPDPNKIQLTSTEIDARLICVS